MVKLLENDFKTEIISMLKESRETNVMTAKSSIKETSTYVIGELKTAILQMNMWRDESNVQDPSSNITYSGFKTLREHKSSLNFFLTLREGVVSLGKKSSDCEHLRDQSSGGCFLHPL